MFFDRASLAEFYGALELDDNVASGAAVGTAIEVKRSRPLKRASRSFDVADKKLFCEMDKALDTEKAADSTAAARLIGERIAGNGTLEHRIERLARKHRNHQR